MGVVEAVVDQLSAKFIIFFLVFAVVLRKVITRLDEHRRIKRLGNYGKDMGSWIPLGSSASLSEHSGLISILTYNRAGHNLKRSPCCMDTQDHGSLARSVLQT